ncbi:MAG: hypothetical protein WBG57_04960, partial [Ornithinimicrobium sp.]
MATKKAAEIARRTLGALVVLCLLVAAAVFYSVAPTPDPSAASAEQDPEGVQTEGDQKQLASEDSSESTATVTVEAAESSPAPAEAVPSGGPGVDEPGILMLVQPTAAGPLWVSEQVRLPEATTSFILAPPELSRAGDVFAGIEPQAVDVQVSAGNQPVVVPDGVVSEPTLVTVPRGSAFEVSYQLSDAMVRSV